MRKGQVTVLENLIYFSIGIAILIATIGVFNSVEAGVESFGREDQYNEVAELTLSNIQNAYIQGTSLNGTYDAQFEIPELIAGSSYEVSANTEGKIIVTSLSGNPISQEITVLGINESVSISGRVTSIRGLVKVKYNPNGNIIIENP